MQPDTACFRAVIVGGGVAGLEAALALHELAGERVHTTVLSPENDFTYRPMAVWEPFARPGASRYRLLDILKPIHATHDVAALHWVDPRQRLVHTDAGESIPYDALLLAVGARQYTRYPRAITLDSARLEERLHGVIQDIEIGAVKRLAFIVPAGRYWPLPAYELALMSARRAWSMGVEAEITILTPEPAPLAVFGPHASAKVAGLLKASEITVITGAEAQVRVPGRITVRGRARELRADAILALPELHGPSLPGVPATARHGFVATDAHGRVHGLQHVFAAGDVTDYPVKQGAIAAQQAACVAQELAGLAGVDGVAEPFMPIIHGVLLGAGRPLYLRARLAGGTPVSSEADYEPLWTPADKIHARHLTAALRDLTTPPGAASAFDLTAA